jgi:lysyl-tRNA synthetase class I
MGDMEQHEVQMLRRDYEIDQYDLWMQVSQAEIDELTWETLVSWYCYEEYCPKCGKMQSADKTSGDRKWYQFECGHFGHRWDYDHDWDPEIQGWIPR